VAAYYNEIDPYAAQWLRNLIAAGHIAPGGVDERSILEVQPDDLRGYDQCHFFAGIGGWSHALRLAEWPDDRPVWTGSCPCQPFSAAGKQRGSDDARHLWPAFFGLIRECGPASVFGEQVAGAAGLAWLDHVLADMEGEDYAAAAATLPACGVGAHHKRERLYWVAHAGSGRCNTTGARDAGAEGQAQPNRRDATGRGCAGDSAGFWDSSAWLRSSDGKARPVEPGSFPLAYGTSARVGRLRAYGNAIVPQVAAVFVMANV
jgi:DNA (cytosine-5)-methyltransferase 1